MRYLIPLCLSCLFFFSIEGFSQKYNEEVTVVAPYEPIISDAHKILENPLLDDTTSVSIETKYSIISKPFVTPISIYEPIKPARLEPDPLTKLYKGYVKGGFGNYITPYLDGYYNQTRSKDNTYGIHVKHHSSLGSLKGYDDTRFSENTIETYGKKMYENYSFTGDLGYERAVNRHYGYNADKIFIMDSVLMKQDDIKQRFQLLRGGVGYRTHFEKADIMHGVQLDYYNLRDKFQANEHHIGLQGDLSKQVSFVKSFTKQQIDIHLSGDFYSLTNAIDKSKTGLVSLSPSYTFLLAPLEFKAGFCLQTVADTLTEIKIYPDVHLKISIIKDILSAYADFSGGTEKNTFKSMSDKNPYVLSDEPSSFTETKRKFLAGFQGALSNRLSFQAEFLTSSMNSMPFYVNEYDTTLVNNNSHLFTLVYDDVDMMQVKGAMHFMYNKKINLSGVFTFSNYILNTEIKAWHCPTYEFELLAHYNLQDKIIVNSSVVWMQDIYAREYNPLLLEQQAIKLKPIVDVNLGLEYRYTKILSGFIQFNNLAASRYYRWSNYPTQRFNLLAGVTYAF